MDFCKGRLYVIRWFEKQGRDAFWDVVKGLLMLLVVFERFIQIYLENVG